MGSTLLLDRSFSAQDQTGPSLPRSDLFADDFSKSLHPALFLSGAVGVKVDDLAVGEPDPESFLHEHVPFFVFGERTLPSAFSRHFFLKKCTTVINEFRGFGQTDGGSWLTGRFVIGC